MQVWLLVNLTADTTEPRFQLLEPLGLVGPEALARRSLEAPLRVVEGEFRLEFPAGRRVPRKDLVAWLMDAMQRHLPPSLTGSQVKVTAKQACGCMFTSDGSVETCEAGRKDPKKHFGVG